MKSDAIVQIILVVLQQLPNLILGLSQIIGKDEVSEEDLEKIRSIVKDPASYFKIE